MKDLTADKRRFLLVGNGAYVNRGCEAIVRGTVNILEREFGRDILFDVASFGPPEVVAEQNALESDPRIRHFSLRVERGSLHWWYKQFNWYFRTRLRANHYLLDESLADACAALQVGGDNYTLDYGPPKFFVELDRYLLRRRVPVVLWGASVGPFDADPKLAERMFHHLRALAAVIVREPVSYDYLQEHTVGDKIFQVPDPAFAMDPIEPPESKIGFALPANAIGINFSPLMARYVTQGDQWKWMGRCIDIVIRVSRDSGRDILLIPHVTSHDNGNDAVLLRRVAESATRHCRRKVLCLGENLTAAETKWIISQCAAFIGARMHAAVAALSTCVPTLSLSYSIKSLGLNYEIFGSTQYCLNAADITVGNVSSKLGEILDQSPQIRRHLQSKIWQMREDAFYSGRLLRQILEKPAVFREQPVPFPQMAESSSASE